MNGPVWNHRCGEANGIGVHYVRHGEGFPLVLHGWPDVANREILEYFGAIA